MSYLGFIHYGGDVVVNNTYLEGGIGVNVGFRSNDMDVELVEQDVDIDIVQYDAAFPTQVVDVNMGVAAQDIDAHPTLDDVVVETTTKILDVKNGC